MCWWSLCQLKIRPTEDCSSLCSSLSSVFGIMVLGLWDRLCWYPIWLLSMVILPHWHPKNVVAQPYLTFSSQSTVPSVAMNESKTSIGHTLSFCQLTISGAWEDWPILPHLFGPGDLGTQQALFASDTVGHPSLLPHPTPCCGTGNIAWLGLSEFPMGTEPTVRPLLNPQLKESSIIQLFPPPATT